MIKGLVILLIAVYQKNLRSFTPSACRFYPSCSEYTKQAILKYGLILGCLKGIKRIFSCQPFYGKSGYDPLI